MKELVNKLIMLNKTIATMESCTGGGLANEITNIEGASQVFSYSAVTYSNEYKIKMGVDEKVINEYTVYSKETAREMAKNISNFANSHYGVGITGKLNRMDINNNYGKNNLIYVSIYEKEKNEFHDYVVEVIKTNRTENKKLVIEKVSKELLRLIKD